MGGPQRHALDILRHYNDLGHDVLALTREAISVDRHFKEAGIPLASAPLRDYPDLFSSLNLKNILNDTPDDNPVVIHVHRYRDALTAIAARRLAKHPDVRIVVTRHISSPAKTNPLRRLIYKNIDAHIFVSEFAKNEFLSAWPKNKYPYDASRLFVAFNSRNAVISPTEIPQRGAITAMWHGTMRTGKGLETIIDALALLKDSRLRLKLVGPGDPDFCDMLRSRALSLGVMERIDWIRKSEDPTLLISSCHFGVLPSVTPEAFGMANIEYMAAGRAQISTFNGAQDEYLSPEVDSIAVPPNHPEALAAAMRRLYDNRTLCAEMGANAAHNYQARLSWPNFIDRLNDIYMTS